MKFKILILAGTITILVIVLIVVYTQRPSVIDLHDDIEPLKPAVELMFQAAPFNYYGIGGSRGLDPFGEGVWLADTGNVVVGGPVCANDSVYVVVEHIDELAMPWSGEVHLNFESNLHALNAGSGEVKWTAELPGAGKLNYAKIVIDESKIYVVTGSRNRDAVAYKLNGACEGEDMWAAPVQLHGSEPSGAVLLEGILAVTVRASDEMNHLHGVDTETGAITWRKQLESQSTAPVSLGDRVAYIEAGRSSDDRIAVFDDAHVVFLNGKTGVTVYEKKLGFTGIWAPPVFVGDKLFAAGLWAAGRVMVECYDLKQPDDPPIWRWDTWIEGEVPPRPGFVVIEERCIFPGSGNKLIMLSLEDGRELPLEIPIEGEILYPPVSNGNLIFLLTEDGMIGAVDPVGGELVWTFNLPEGHKPLPGSNMAYCNGRLFCPEKAGMLLAIE